MEEKTLEELKEENNRLKKQQGKLQELDKQKEEIQQLKRENKQLEFRLKHGKAVAVSQAIINKTAKFGIKAWQLTQKYGKHLAEAERKEKANQKEKEVKNAKSKSKRPSSKSQR